MISLSYTLKSYLRDLSCTDITTLCSIGTTQTEFLERVPKAFGGDYVLLKVMNIHGPVRTGF